MEQNKTSLWLCIAIIVVSATMMHPGIATLIAMPIVAVLVFILRSVAHIEGAKKQ